MIVENDVCYNIFAKYGFSWGGLWSDPSIISILKRNPDKILQVFGLSNLQKQTEVPAHGGTGEREYSECHQISDTEHYFPHKGEDCLTPLPARPLKT